MFCLYIKGENKMHNTTKTLIGVGVGFFIAIVLVCIGLSNNWFLSEQKSNEPEWTYFLSGTETYYIAPKPDTKYNIVKLDDSSFKIEYDGKMYFDTPLIFYRILPETFQEVQSIEKGYMRKSTANSDDVFNIDVYQKHKNGNGYGTKYVLIQIRNGESRICCETDMPAEQIFQIFDYMLAKNVE